jgi:RHH-type proline utilization regulon transcriptional repressor/proline dehydrogenase/delta 1-pyrroline-5-carboxylate dehydrogenase
MCLAEALLRIPDAATRDALIRDKIGARRLASHLGRSRRCSSTPPPGACCSPASWSPTHSERLGGLGAALTQLIARGGEPLIRKGVDAGDAPDGRAVRHRRDHREALANAREREAEGFRYSYDMLGEAAMTAPMPRATLAAYRGDPRHRPRRRRPRHRRGPGISVKLSALHPRYSRAQRDACAGRAVPRLRDWRCWRAATTSAQHRCRGGRPARAVARPARAAVRRARARRLERLGFVVQAYQKRAPFVIDWLIDLARRGSGG